MGKISNTMNYYFSDSKRFADLFNVVFFQGEPLVDAGDLIENSAVYHQPITGNQGERAERIHDVCKRLRTGGVLRILALENQNLVDYAMPFRCMQYDVMEYGQQLDEIRRRNKREQKLGTREEIFSGLQREDRLKPVYTLCLYHGDDEWDGPRSLQDMMKFEGEDDIFRKWFNDYPMRLYCVDEVENFSLYRTEVGTLFRALRYRKDRPGLRRLLESDPNYRHLDKDTLEAMAILLKIPKVWEKRERYMRKNEDREEYDMCQAIKEWAEEERRIGIEESRVAIIKNLIRRGDTDEDIIQVVGCSQEYLAGIRETD